MLLIATATHVVSLGTVSLVVVATVLKLVTTAEVVGLPKKNVPLLLVVQLIGDPETTNVNKDDEVLVLKADVEVSVGNDMLNDVVLIIVAEFE
ncbi:hypothetical protein KCU86_g17474, partial [Aureobasidium melanogenum]